MYDNYCIRSDYVARDTAETVESSHGSYWTQGRRNTARKFQYYVYLKAAELLKERFGSNATVIDVGCGYPWKANALLVPVASEVTACDQHTLESTIVKEFPSLNYISIDLECPRAINEQYDLVICSDVIEHLLEPDATMEFLKALCKHSGYIILSTPERVIVRGKDCLRSPKPEHVREWSKDEFYSYCSTRGLKVETHTLLPEKKLSLIEEYLPLVIKKVIGGRRWFGCQMVVARAR